MNETVFSIADDKKTLRVERLFPAGKARVWDAYTKPEILSQWWGPKGWETEIAHFDFTVGGYWHYCMRCVDKAQGDFYGMESWGKGTYTAISAKDSLSYDDAFCNESAEINADMPISSTTVTFVEENGQTRLISTTSYASEEALQQVLAMGMEEGFKQTLDNLEELLLAEANSPS
jgi:uncharacterized protein YndB with AHSA1/START domain